MISDWTIQINPVTEEIGEALGHAMGPEMLELPLQLTPVRWTSGKRNRSTLERLAKYFQREFRYDFIQYISSEPRSDDIGFLWSVEIMDKRVVDAAVGGCVFRSREAGWALAWVWFHPFVRRQGLLSDAWPYFRRRFGSFDVEEPLSDSMDKFLAKQGER